MFAAQGTISFPCRPPEERTQRPGPNHPNQITQWTTQLQEPAAKVFGPCGSGPAAPAVDGITPDQAYFNPSPFRAAAYHRQDLHLSARRICSDNRDHLTALNRHPLDSPNWSAYDY
jgi:hypothetical protein